MSDNPHPIHLLVAGHTNVGKTSLLRTLGRSTGFGDVSPSPSTTRQIVPIELIRTETLTLTAYDSPGLENAGRLLEQLDDQTKNSRDQSQAIRDLLATPSAREDFEQECRVLAQALKSNACLAVLDAREPVLEKYLDELLLLARCGRPLLPVLNFTVSQESLEQEWRERLATIGQHVVIAFDAVVYSMESERRLYRGLATVLPDAESSLETLIQQRESDSDWRLEAATHALSEGLIEIAACQELAPANQPRALASAVDRLTRYVEVRERRMTKEILEAFNYAPDILGNALHPDYTDTGRWSLPPFSREAARYYGIRATGPIGAGAVVGSTLDIATGGTLLGAGTATGALAGGLISAHRALLRAGRKLLRQQETVAPNDTVLNLIATRNLQLITSLQSRGHASTKLLNLPQPGKWTALGDSLPTPLRRAREMPAWSDYQSTAETLTNQNKQPSSGIAVAMQSARLASRDQAREHAIARLKEHLLDTMESQAGAGSTAGR
ncbi:hypothetical protein J2T57_000692 [Natronocella acetinitrilica]|uniref:G domain-containing protein n=1 Tax=Natronocella acetinitrilica TaxID=414046 RepID=A0AAE3KBH6_9GAMM|nr:DUF3482 domain-containing protein [Natronocella acetinitrilica]MCP1673593.1 hypothetical protein [Natronocella acetinitrilica]